MLFNVDLNKDARLIICAVIVNSENSEQFVYSV